MNVSAIIVSFIISGLIVTILIRMGFYEWLTSLFIYIYRNLLRWSGLISDPGKSGPFPPITFRIRAYSTKCVYLPGSFNEWLRASSPGSRITPDPAYRLYRNEDDTWEITLYDLMPGTHHEYAFAIDYGMGYFQR